MIKLSNGFSFEYVTASGALSSDGRGYFHEQPLRWLSFLDPSLFLNFIKTPTLSPRAGNFRWYKPWASVRPMPGGAVNAFGLRNKGIHWWAKNIGPKIDSSKIPVAGSIFGEPDELCEMAEIMNEFDLIAQEINVSCPNTETDVLRNCKRIIESVKEVKKSTRHVLGLKVSVAQQGYIAEVLKEIKGMIEFLTINSVPWSIVFPNRKSPLAKYGGGGVSGKIAQPFTWPFAEELQRMTTIPVIAPSVWDFDDLGKLRQKGFKAFSFGAVHLMHPWRPTLFVRREQKLLNRRTP